MNEAVGIVQTLQSRGHKAYFAGGSVRDMLLGQHPADFDIVTSAKPDEVERIFPSTVPVGKEFGIIIVNTKEKSYEVATFRQEGEYLDGRRPSYVTFTDEEEDAKRRDFTVNGIFYDPISKKVIDYVEGQEDIKKRIIRFIGRSEERINEDHLRILRAVRFKTTLEFDYSPETLAAVTKHACLVANVSPERIRHELNKIFSHKNRFAGLSDLNNTGLLEHILPEVTKLHNLPQPVQYHKEGDAFVHTCLAVQSLPSSAASHITWAVLLHDVGKAVTIGSNAERITFYGHAEASAKIAEDIMKRLKFTNYEVQEISWLIKNHMRIAGLDKMRPNKRMAFLLNPWFHDLIVLAKADAMGTKPVNTDFIAELESALAEARVWRQTTKARAELMLITGHDLTRLGLAPSPKFKEILDDIEDLKLEGKITTKEQALEYVTKKFL